MRSPPSIFAQSPGSVPAANLDGPSHFESTETGQTPFELKYVQLPRTRTGSLSESASTTPSTQQTIDILRQKALDTADDTALRANSQSQPSEDFKAPSKRPRQDVDPDSESEELKRRRPGAHKRPKLVLPPASTSREHSNSDTDILKRAAAVRTPKSFGHPRIPRLSKDDSDLVRAFNPVDFANPGIDPRRPVSPLFFSHTPGSHRPFTARFNSGDSGARLLEVTGMEDAGGGGGAVRTVNMARGSIGSMSPPGLSTYTSPRGSHPSLKLGMSRSLSARGAISEASTSVPSADEQNKDKEKEPSGAGISLLSQAGVLELLDQDDRPTFVLDLSYKTNYQPGPLHISFSNAALRAYPGLLEAIRGRGAGETPASFSPTPSFPEFKHWITSFVTNNEASAVNLPALTFAGFVWRSSTMKKRFRVVSGVLAHGTSVGVPLSTPGGSSISNIMSSGSVHYQEEPADYFGSGALPVLKEAPRESESAGTDPDHLKVPNENSQTTLVPSRPDSAASVLAEQLRDESPQTQKSSAMQLSSNSRAPLGALLEKNANEIILQAATAGNVDWFGPGSESYAKIGNHVADAQDSAQYYFDWTRLPISASLPRHIQFARSVDWSKTSLGPIEGWSGHLRATSCLIMASPHPAAMYWGDDYVAIYNEPYILLAGQKHPELMGTPYSIAWAEIWDNVKDSFAQARNTGQSTMKDDDRLFINRNGFLEETYFSWSIIPLVGDDGSVVGLYNPAFEKTRRKIAERRMLTLREVGEKTAAAREVKGFWGAVLTALEYNEYDTPFVLLYSVSEDETSDEASVHSNSIVSAKQCTLEGTLPTLPPDHPAAPPVIDLKYGTEGFAPIFREAMMTDKHILLEADKGTLDTTLLDNMDWRGFQEKPRAAVVSPIHPTTGESIIGFLVMGVNPRRPYDDDYNLFVTLLTRQLATSMASVVLFEEEIRRGQRAAKLAALDRIELSQQLEARTLEARESETKFTRMAEFAPVGIFIANKEGDITFTNGVFHSLTHLPKYASGDKWTELVKDEDKPKLETLWNDVVHRGLSKTTEIRFKGEWKGNNDAKGEVWVLCSVFAEKYPDGTLKSIFGSLTDISQQKWAEGIQIKRTEEAIELKRQQSNFIDMTSHEMRNPLSAILQSADEIAGSLLEYKNGKDPNQIPLDLIDSNIDAAQTISLCANHQTRIVSDVLTLSKLDSALLLVTPVDVQPRIILQQAMKMFEGEMQTADIKLKVEIDEKSLDSLGIEWVRLDPSRLLQVLINLMTNAIKFTTPEAHRSITISLEACREPPSKKPQTCVDYIPRTAKRKNSNSMDSADWGDGEPVYLSFAVRDTGKGLSEDEKKLLFLRFSQASPKTHVQYGGSGLGLFISRELVELQGGEIGVSSQSGKGSTFAFYVQARKSQAPSGDTDGELSRSLSTSGGITGLLRKSSVTRAIRPSLSTPASPSNKASTLPTTLESNGSSQSNPPKKQKITGLEYLNILIVEDNLVNQKVLAKQLRNVGCQVTVANHGEEALAHLRETKYWRDNDGKSGALECSVILMDLEMPVMDGLTCTRRIREMEASGELIGHSPIIAVSANARSAHIDSAIEAGMDDVVSKPFRIPELVPKVEQLVEKHRGGKPQSTS